MHEQMTQNRILDAYRTELLNRLNDLESHLTRLGISSSIRYGMVDDLSSGLAEFQKNFRRTIHLMRKQLNEYMFRMSACNLEGINLHELALENIKEMPIKSETIN